MSYNVKPILRLLITYLNSRFVIRPVLSGSYYLNNSEIFLFEFLKNLLILSNKLMLT